VAVIRQADPAELESARLVGVAFSLPRRAADGAGPVVPGQRHLTGFAVIPERQRRGIGRGLLATVLEDARREGSTRVTLWTHAANVPARKLFEAAGFLSTGRRELDADGAEMLQLESVL
jgi:ribosomal protein S18 acetylase RimI-like enzyme